MAKRRKGSDKKRGARKHQKAVKRARKLKARTPPADRAPPAATPSLFNPLASILGPTNPAPPPWATSAAFTPAAAEMVAKAGMLMDGKSLHPYLVAKLREYTAWQGKDWTISQARSTPTGELVERLARFGVELDEARFRTQAAAHRSAWALAESWGVDEASEQFLGLAACELWRRWCPDPPSLEMLDDQIQEGFALRDAGDLDGAQATWLAAWDGVCERIPPEVTTMAEADELLGGMQPLGNWAHESIELLQNHAIGHRDRAERGLAWCRQVRARFTDNARPLLEQEAEFLYMVGEHREAEALLTRQMEEDPDDPMPYAILADHLGLIRPEISGSPRDIPRAIALLETALARPVRDPEGWGLASRLTDLRKQAPS